ncbi:MAG: Hpt domain-containing protein [Verrucomicrobiales bacterium]
MNGNQDNLSDFSMAELFRMEAENQLAALTQGLLRLEQNSAAREELDGLMRAAHSIKGAARIVNFEQAVRVSHQMEDLFVSAQNGQKLISRHDVDVLLKGVDLLKQIAEETVADPKALEIAVDQFLRELTELTGESATAVSAVAPLLVAVSGISLLDDQQVLSDPPPPLSPSLSAPPRNEAPDQSIAHLRHDSQDRSLRVTAANLDRLLGLAGEFLVESR